MRKLASIQKIKSIEPIDGADKIEKATVLGWEVVVKRGEFKPGDTVVYCEIDSVLPPKEEFAFLEKAKYRIRTIRLRGQISQGICFPTNILPDNFEIEIGKECTEELGIVKYEVPEPASLGGNAKGTFPSFIVKTDETRIQSIEGLLEKYQGQKFYIAEKLEGSSATYFLNEDRFGVCSRNMELEEDDKNTFWKVAKELDIENKLRNLGRNIAIQGELIGPSIQGNIYKLKSHTVRFFSCYDIDKKVYLTYNEFIDIMWRLQLNTIPILSDNYILENDIKKVVNRSIIKSNLNPDSWAEGIVVRLISDKVDFSYSNSGIVSFKAINPEYLL